MYCYELLSSGNKWTFLILHGWWWDHLPWITLWKMLHWLGYNVLIPDLPGHWKTSLDSPYTIEKYAEFVCKLCLKYKIKSPILVWHSNWWRIAIYLVAHQMLEVSQLFLIASAWINKKPTVRNILLKHIAWFLKPLLAIPWVSKLRSLLYRIVWGHDYLAITDPFIKQTFLNVLGKSMEDEMQMIKCKTHLIWGNLDTYTPLSSWKRMHELIKGSTFTVLEWEKHWIHRTSPDKLFNLIKDYLW